CNRYATPAILAKIQRRQHDAGAGGACQREHRWMPVLRDYYGPYAQRLLNGYAAVLERRLRDAISELLSRGP
ncbi:MAG: hypothetical protein ACFCUJ_02425, partial [Thiotrichales bacterium]